MTDTASTPQRVVMTIDSGRFSDTTLDYAVSIAARLKRPLVGIFLEDTDLLSSADLPFSTEICLFTGQPRQLGREQLQAAMAELARRFRHRLAQRAEQQSISWSVNSVRGRWRDLQIEQVTATDYCIYEGGRSRRAPQRADKPTHLLVIDGHDPGFYQTLCALLAPLEKQPLQLSLVLDEGQQPPAPLLSLLPTGTRVEALATSQLPAMLPGADQHYDYVVVSRRHWLAQLAPQLARLSCPLIIVE